MSESQWLAEQFEGITEKIERLSPSALAEKIRFISATTSNNPGPFRWDVSPYMREILDCFDPESGIWFVAVKKGVQVAFTVAVLENLILYYLYQIRTAPLLFVTESEELADKRVQTNIVPMIQESGLEHLVQSSDRLSTKKQGKTSERMEWLGGGWMIAIGARNPGKMRSLPFPAVVADEIDGWQLQTRDGPPWDLVLGRTKTYESTRKVLAGSTPVDKETSLIQAEFLKGDQRRYFVRCMGCDEHITIRWERKDEHGRKIGGFFFDLKNGQVVRSSVRFVCHHCGFAHVEEDKATLLYPEHGAEWRPTATPIDPGRRSYHVPAFISTVQTWYACVCDFVDAVGEELDPTRPKDMGKLKVFYNNILGEPFEVQGARPSLNQVLGYRRQEYALGTVPQNYAHRVTGSRIGALICAVDVHPHKGNIQAAVFGFTRGFRIFLVDYVTFEGNPGDTQDPGTWGALSKMLEEKTYQGDDGAEYQINFAAVDSGVIPDQVYAFCNQYPDAPIFPIKGRDEPVSGSTMPFAPFKTANAGHGFTLVVDHYKDRWSYALRKTWSDGGGVQQPEIFFNAPANLSDDALMELTKEYKRPVKPTPGKIQRRAYEWHRPHGSNNELWDLLIYASGILDVVCFMICTEDLGLERQDWDAFWNYAEGL